MRTRVSAIAFAIAFAAALSAAATAMANGRFPRAQRLVESSERPEVMALYGTYGLLVTSDGGRSWRHVCEAATGPYTGEDPLLEILPGDRLFVRTETHLAVSAGSWCNWQPLIESEAGLVQDITREASEPNTVLALTSEALPAIGYTSRLLESENGGLDWAPAMPIPREMMGLGLSLDLAPSSRSRLYLTGIDETGTGKILVSNDRGRTFQSHAIPGTGTSAAPYIAAVSRVDPDRVFVRTDGYEVFDGIDTALDTLLLSTDGGRSFVPILQREAKLFGFALSPDESTLLVGYGDPVFAATYVEAEHLGIYRASVAEILSDPGAASDRFEKIYEGSVTCLRWTASGLFACTSQSEKGFEVGRAADGSFSLAEPMPFEPRLRLPEVAPLACAPGTDAHVCYTDPDDGFPAVCRVLGASCDVQPPLGVPDAGQTDPDAAGSGSTAGAGGVDGGADAAAGTGSAGQAGTGEGRRNGGGCGCELTGPSTRGDVTLGLGLWMAIIAWRRARRRARRLT